MKATREIKRKKKRNDPQDKSLNRTVSQKNLFIGGIIILAILHRDIASVMFFTKNYFPPPENFKIFPHVPPITLT